MSPCCPTWNPRSIARPPRHPNPGRTDTFRRLNRTEYQNAIRDLLALEIDAAALLPADESSHGFDNVTVGDLSPTLLDRYVTAAQKISRLAVGGAAARRPAATRSGSSPTSPRRSTSRACPLGTRGGALIRYTFPRDGEYEIQIRLARDRNEHVEGLHEPHELEVLLDRERVQSFTVKPPAAARTIEHVDAHLKLRFAVKAGPHDLGVTFLKNPSSLLETTAPAVPRPLQHAPAPAALAGRLPGLDHRPVRRPRAPGTRPAAGGSSSRGRNRRPTRRPARGRSSRR